MLRKSPASDALAEIFKSAEFSSLKPATLLKKRLAQVFSCEFWEIPKNTFFVYRTPLVAASDSLINCSHCQLHETHYLHQARHYLSQSNCNKIHNCIPPVIHRDYHIILFLTRLACIFSLFKNLILLINSCWIINNLFDCHFLMSFRELHFSKVTSQHFY